MSDVRIYQNVDSGEIDYLAGRAVMVDGLESAAYLSMFGGNARDSGGQDGESLQWWGNLGESDPARQYRSETQYLLQSLPLVPANLRRIEDAAGRDLAWFMDSIASSVTVVASIPAVNTVKLAITMFVNGQKYSFEFIEMGKRQS